MRQILSKAYEIFRQSLAARHAKYPRRESNPHLRFRKPPFYPLNYGDEVIYDWRFSIVDLKAKIALSRLSAAILCLSTVSWLRCLKRAPDLMSIWIADLT